MNNSVIGLDIAKNIFHLFTLLADGKVLKKKLKRSELLAFFANYPASVIGIEAVRECPSLGQRIDQARP
jgi:transposase